MTTTEPLPKAWTADGHSERIAALELLPRRVSVLLAAGWARAGLAVWEATYPEDDRPRKAVEAAEGWVFGTTEHAYAAADAAYASYVSYAVSYAAADAAYAAYAALAASDAADAAYAADAASAASCAYASYAASATADAAYASYAASTASASTASASTASAAAASAGGWQWIHRTYCHARGPEGLVFEPAWKTDTATALAREIAKTRAFDLMPILADAIQDAGCDHAELLAHLRGDMEEMTLADWSLCQLLGLWDGKVAV